MSSTSDRRAEGEGVSQPRNLPPGTTCVDCIHFKPTCEWLLNYSGTETVCDWFPIKFEAPTQLRTSKSTPKATDSTP
jgi:hypothetical protein